MAPSKRRRGGKHSGDGVSSVSTAIRPGMSDQQYFEGSTAGWLIVTNRKKPLLYNGQIPMFWNRAVARFHLQAWMREGKCTIVRARVLVKGARHE